MNEEIQIKIIELIDGGATPESSNELKQLIESTEEAKAFYKSFMASEASLKKIFGGDKANELNNKISTFIDEQFEKPSSNTSNLNFKPILGFALAASFAFLAINFINSPEERVETVAPVEIAYEGSEEVIEETVIEVEPQPMYLAGSDIDTLWSAATQIANELGADRYQVMYALYEANKEFFINEDINNPRADRDYFIDTAIIESVDVTFASREVKRHIYCSC